MLRLGETNVAKEKFYGAKKNNKYTGYFVDKTLKLRMEIKIKTTN